MKHTIAFAILLITLATVTKGQGCRVTIAGQPYAIEFGK